MREESYKPLQEDPEAKERWRREVMRRWPIGARVRVLSCDGTKTYAGMTGRVRGYDLGIYGEWPMVSVYFDVPDDWTGPSRDSFDVDHGELELIEFAPFARLREWLERRVKVRPARRGVNVSWRGGVHVEWWGRFPGHFCVDVESREVDFKLYWEGKE